MEIIVYCNIETVRANVGNYMKIIKFIRGIFCLIVVTSAALEGAEKTGPLKLQNNALQKKVPCLNCLEEGQVQKRQLLARFGHTESWVIWSGSQPIDKLCLASLEGNEEGIREWSKIADVNELNTVHIDHIQNGQRLSKCYRLGAGTPLMYAILADKIGSAIALLGGINHQNACAQHAVMAKTAEKIDCKINVDRKNYWGSTALHMAAINHSQKWAIPLLLDHGANINIQDDCACTPLHVSCVENVPVLIEYGADMNIADICGWSPLYHAVSISSPLSSPFFCDKKVPCLLESGAFIDGINKYTEGGVTNLYMLQQNSDTKKKELALTFLIQGEMSKTEKSRQMRPLSFLCIEALGGNIVGLPSCPPESYNTWSNVVQFLIERKTILEAAESLQQLFEAYKIEQKDREAIISKYAHEEATSQAYERVACYHGPDWSKMSAEKQIAEAVSVMAKRQEHVEKMLFNILHSAKRAS